MRRQRENTSCGSGPPLGHGWSPPPYVEMPRIRGYHAPPTLGCGGMLADCGPLSPTLSMLSSRYPHLRCNTTSTMSERFSRTPTSPPRMPDPVVFNAGFTFRINEERPKVYDHVKVDPASSVPHTASFSLTKKIDRFLKKSDHTLDRFQDIIQQKKLNLESSSPSLKKIPPPKPPRLGYSEEKELPRSREPSDSSHRSKSLLKASPPSSSSIAATAERHRRILAKVVANGALRKKRRQDDLSSSSSTSSSDDDEFESESGGPRTSSKLYERSDDTSAEISKLSSMDVGGGGCSRSSMGPPRLEDLSSGSDEEYFDVHPLPAYFCIPSLQASQDLQERDHGGSNHVAPSNAPVKHSLIIGPSWKRTPRHCQSLPAVNKIPCPAKMGNANIPPPVSEASQEMQPLRIHKKKPAPPPPVSREPSFVSVDSLTSRNGSLNAQLGSCLSASVASVNTLDSVSPHKKPHRSPSLKKYPAPQPPSNSHGDTVTFKTNSLPRNSNWRNSFSNEITQLNNPISKTISENPIPGINYLIKRPGSPIPNSRSTLPVRLKPSNLNYPNTRTTPFIQISKDNHFPTSAQASVNFLFTPLSTRGQTVDSDCIGINENVKLPTNIKIVECESNLDIPEKTSVQLLKNNDIIEKNVPPCSDNLATPIIISGNVSYESENDSSLPTPVTLECGLPICNEETELELIDKNQCNFENKQDISNGIQHSAFGIGPKDCEENSISNLGLELSYCKDQENEYNLCNTRIGEVAKKGVFNSLSVNDKIENSNDKVVRNKNTEDCGDKSNSKRKSLVIKESLDVSDSNSQSRQGSVSNDSISSRGSRETSVSSTSSDNLDLLSRKDQFFIKRSKSGKLAALASKFESEDKNGFVATPLKPNMNKGSNKFARNKIAGLTNLFVGDSQNKDSNKLQSPYSKPFSPESSLSEKVKKNIGGIDVSKFGEVATNIKDFRPRKKVGEDVVKNEIKSKALHDDKSNYINDDIKPKLKDENSKFKEDGKLKEKKKSLLLDDGKNILNGETKESNSKDTGDSKTKNENKSIEESSLKTISILEASNPLIKGNKTTDKKEEDHPDLSLAKRRKKKRPTKDAPLPFKTENAKINAGDGDICSVKEINVDLPKPASVKIENGNSGTKNADVSSMNEVSSNLCKSVPTKIEKEKITTEKVEVCSMKEPNADLPKSIPTKIEKEKITTKNVEICSVKETKSDISKSVPTKIKKEKTTAENVEVCSLLEPTADLPNSVPTKIKKEKTTKENVEIGSLQEPNADLHKSIPTKIEKEKTTNENVEIYSMIETNADISKSVPTKIEKEKTTAENVDVCSLPEPNADLPKSIPTKIEKEKTTAENVEVCSLQEPNADLPKSIPTKREKEKTTAENVEVCSLQEPHADLPKSIPTEIEKDKTTNEYVEICSMKETNADIPKSVPAKIEKEKTTAENVEVYSLKEPNADLSKSVPAIIEKEKTTAENVEVYSLKEPNADLPNSISTKIEKEMTTTENNENFSLNEMDAIILVEPFSDRDKLVESCSIVENNLLMQHVVNNNAILNIPSVSDDSVTIDKSLVSKLTETKVMEKRGDLIDNHMYKLTSHENKESVLSEVQNMASSGTHTNRDSSPMEADLKSMSGKPTYFHLENGYNSVPTGSLGCVNSSSLLNEKPLESPLIKLTEYIPTDGSEPVLNLSKLSIIKVVDKLTSSDAIHDILQAGFQLPKSGTLTQNIETSIPVVACATSINLEPMPAAKVADALSQSVLQDVSIQMNQISTHIQKPIPYIDSNISSDIPVAANCVEKSLDISTTMPAIVPLGKINQSAATAGNDKITDSIANSNNNNLNTTEFAKTISNESITDKLESPIRLLSNENILVVSTTNFELENTSQRSCILGDPKYSLLPNLTLAQSSSPMESSFPTSINLSTGELSFPSNHESSQKDSTTLSLDNLHNKIDTDVSINKDGIMEDITESSVGLFQGMVNSLKTSFSKVMLHASSNSINIEDQCNVAIVDKSDSMPENATGGAPLESFITENNCYTSPSSSSPEYQSASSSTNTVNSIEIDVIKNDVVNNKKNIVGSETGARSKRPSNVSMPEEVLNVSEILREAEERLTRALEKDPLVYRYPIGKVDDVYLDAFDPSQFDILMPLPTSEDRMLLDRRSRSSTPYLEGLDRRSPTPNRIVEQTEALLSETDRILRKSRSHNSLRRSYTRSLSGMNLNRLREVTADLTEEHSTSHLAGERIEAEQAERMRLEKEVNDLQSEVKRMTDTNDKLELERLALKTEMLHVELNGDIHDSDDAADAALYKRKYEWSLRELEVVKKQLKQQQEDDLDQLLILKKQLEKKICDSHEETEEQRQVATQLKKKSQRLQAEMNDMKILLEEQTSRNNLLEKKQRKFDQDVHVIQEELRNEKLSKDKIQREKDQTLSEKYSFEQEVASLKLELDLKEEKVAALTREINDLNFTGKAEEEVAILKKAKHDLELRVKDQEEELDDLAGQVQMLESARLRLEMSIEQMRKENRKEAQMREEEMEEVRVAAQKKVKAFEAQLESEHDERTQLMREKHELERRLAVIQERTFATVDEDAFHKVKKELKKTKALLKDTQTMLEKSQSEGSNKLLLRQLKTQLEDAEFAKTAAIKARQSADSEVAEIQSQLEEALRTKNDAEERCVRHIKEKTEMQSQLEEGEEEVAEVMKKYKATVSQLSIDQINISEQAQMIAELEHEKQVLQERLIELSSKVEVLEGETANIHTQRRLQMKIKELESKLELESTTRQRLESQITRLKDQVERLCSECDSAKSKEIQTQDFCKKLNRQLREAKEDLTNIQQKLTDSINKKQEVEKQFELAESEIITLKSDLKLAFKRIEDLQQALQGDLSDSDTELTDSDSESETSLTSYLTASATQDRPLSNSTEQKTENESPSESKMMDLMVCSPTSIREDMEDDYKESFA